MVEKSALCTAMFRVTIVWSLISKTYFLYSNQIYHAAILFIALRVDGILHYTIGRF